MKVKNPNDIDVLVNKERWLPKDFRPLDLVYTKVNFLENTTLDAMMLRREAARALGKMFKKARKDKIILYAVSGFRSYERQREIFKKNFEIDGERANKYSARAGQSEHQTGLAMDVTCEDVRFSLIEEFAKTDAYSWLYNNSYKYGFVIRYPSDKVKITGYNFEPWHLRYLGKELAQKLFFDNKCLEEYY